MPTFFDNARQRERWSEEAVLLLFSAFWAVTAQGGFLAGALAGRSWSDPGLWGVGAALLVGLTAIHFIVMGVLAHRALFKPVVALLVVVTAFATFYIRTYNVYLDPSMLRNVLRTDPHEARELLGLSLLPTLLVMAGLPLLVLWKLKLRRRSWPRGLAVRLGSLLAALAVLVAAVLAVFQPLASLMRNHKELRYLITPANVVWSLASVAGLDARTAAGPKKVIGEDAKPGGLWVGRSKPAVLVLVVGETARAANWGLSGYSRQTTPELATLPVINFAQVTSCGTNTETSLPCMFAPIGRRDYDEARIRGSQSLLHVLARAGVGVQWIDNQSGCKGVCDGLPNTHVVDLAPPGLCKDGRCFDMGLLHGLADKIKAADPAKGPQLVVLHQLGSHGPSYFRRVPPEFARFTPFCQSDDLHKCSREEIVNAYDNALLYTDHVLATLVRQLQGMAGSVDSAVLYVSDHGESLGENNLFLHGIPFAIAPDVQTRVPMVLWASEGFTAGLGLDTACLTARATKPATHDHLFHTVLSLLDVKTALHDPAWDLTTGCRAAR
jgi:lipid A ethanolaminephosphotransferase